MIVYVSFGNSDDKLPQRQWVLFQFAVKDALREVAAFIHGEWHSYPDSIFQNACFCVEIEDERAAELKATVTTLAGEFQQEAIAWCEGKQTLFLGPGGDSYTEPEPA